MDEITRNAYAKINLGLDVIRKREDGYHDLKMIMQTINLYDQLTFRVTNTPEITLRSNLSTLPTNDNNLVIKAAKLMKQTYGIENGLSIKLSKHIPVAAGLAGGSADAATTMLAMNELFHLNLSQTELMELGVNLGADIPYCIMRGTVLAEGIGEILTPLPPLRNCSIVVVKPNINVSTKYVYQNLKIDEDTIHPDINSIIKCINTSNISGMCSLFGNVLETVTIPRYPRIEAIKKEMMHMGAVGSLMSGSGPTVFGIFTNYKAARNCYNSFKRGVYRHQTFLAVPYQPENPA